MTLSPWWLVVVVVGVELSVVVVEWLELLAVVVGQV